MIAGIVTSRGHNKIALCGKGTAKCSCTQTNNTAQFDDKLVYSTSSKK